MRSLTSTCVSLVLTLCLTGAAHAQRTINDCEAIQAADAYNQCLAKFGPPAKSLNVESARPGDIKSGSEEAAAGAGSTRGARVGRRHGRGGYAVRRSRGGGRIAHVRGGRKRMTISVGR